MTPQAIRAALEGALAGMTPALATAWENVSFVPAAGTPYQRAWLLLAEPQQLHVGGDSHAEQGVLQIDLCYPPGAGPSAAYARASLLRTTFAKDARHGGVKIVRTPEILPAVIESNWYILRVRIRFVDR